MQSVRFLLVVWVLFFSAPSLAAALTADYAAWAKHNKDGSWTKLLEKRVTQSKLPSYIPRDISQFCPKYSRLNQTARSQFWVGLLSAMAKPESHFKSHRHYKERFKDSKGRPVISRGLLQISHESANQPRYNCAIKQAQELHQPETNLNCAVKILEHWVKADGVIAAHPLQQAQPAKHQGGARYWSVLRAERGHLDSIKHFTRQLPSCA